MNKEQLEEVEEKDEQPKKKSSKKEEETPKWATEMINTMKSLSEKLTSNQTQQTEQEEVIKVEVPPMPQPKEELEEETIMEVEQLEEEVQKPSKKKTFLDYLF